MNYGNRNATSQQTSTDILKGYTAAVTSAIGVSYTCRRLFAPITANLQGGVKFLANSGLNWVGIAVAGFLNTYCMRMSEMERGIVVFDENK